MSPARKRSISYEIGLKSQLADRRITLNASAFHYDFTNQQFANIVGIGNVQLVNAGRSRIQGLEIEASVRPVRGLLFSAGLGLLDAKYKQLVLNGVDLSGNRLIEAPKYTLNLAGDYAIPVGDDGAVTLHGDYGPGGMTGVVSDLVALVEQARAENAGLPLVLLGHSMGSMIAQAFVPDHADLIDGLVLSGSAAVDVVAAVGAKDPDLFGALNSPFAPGRTGFDWLSRDEAEVDAYVADPLCGFSLIPESMVELFGQGASLADPQRIAAIPQDLPIWIASGDADPLYSLLGAVEPLIARYREAGLKVEAQIYPGARHEILNETNRAEVVGDLGAWLDRVIAGIA